MKDVYILDHLFPRITEEGHLYVDRERELDRQVEARSNQG